MKIKLILFASVFIPFLSGCGAPKPPQPSGQKISIEAFAQKRAEENRLKVAAARAGNQSETNIRFGYEDDREEQGQ